MSNNEIARRSSTVTSPWNTAGKKARVGAWVTVKGFKPSHSHFNGSTGRVIVNLESVVEPRKDDHGRPLEKRKALYLNYGSMAELIADLGNRFGAENVVYSDFNSEAAGTEAHLKREWLAEKQEQADAAEQTRQYDEAIAAHRAYCLANPKEAEKQWGVVIEMMMAEPDMRSEFVGRRDFFHYPLDSNNEYTHENWVAFTQICHKVINVPYGVSPSLAEAIDAYRYGSTNHHFHQFKSYKRSQTHLRDQVKPVEASIIKRDAESLRASAMRKINEHRLPVGTSVTREKALKMGLTSEEFEALIAERKDLHKQDLKTLGKEVQALRPKSKLGGPLNY